MTDPTADAAKRLPSGCPVPGCPATGDGKPYAGVPTCMQGYAGDPAAYENYIRGCVLRGNTRPQPAPPEGEPDFAALACQIGFEHDEEWSELEISYGGGGRNINRERLIEIIKTLAERMYRLGLATRPNVADAEVENALRVLKRGSASVEAQAKAADLLERLAGERDDKERKLSLQIYNHEIEHVQLIEMRGKLAEREAELAKADAVIEKLNSQDGDIRCAWDDALSALVRKCLKRHAARQQQKASAEPTEREGE